MQPADFKIGDEVEAQIEGWFYAGVVVDKISESGRNFYKIKFCSAGWNNVCYRKLNALHHVFCKGV